MPKSSWVLFCIFAMVIAAVVFFTSPVAAGPQGRSYKVLAPISRDNLTIFPVVSDAVYDTREFISLDEGVRSGEVVVTEAGRVPPMVRRRPVRPIMPNGDGAQVNQLMLVNNSDRPLLLLAGEIVTGGKQDRIIGKDRIVPANSDPIDLGVFCVEPGRWVGASSKFGATTGQLAQPNVRAGAMAAKDQGKVWAEVRDSNQKMAKAAPQAAPELATTSSYAAVVGNREVKSRVDAVAVPLENSYAGLRRQLHDRNAVGVVVAVNGQIIWADLFASPGLLEKYWPKLVRSYASEAVTMQSLRAETKVSTDAAQDFINRLYGGHEVVETEPGVFRQVERTGDGFKVFELTSLLQKSPFAVHLAKMTTGDEPYKPME